MKIPSASQRRSAMEINMTPMIDMVFLLIVYFVWTSGDSALETLLPSRIAEQAGTQATPSDVPPPEADFDPVVVRVAREGGNTTWRVNEQSLGSLQELRSVLQKLAEIKRDAPVILDPEGDVSLGDAIDVYDLARRLGFEKVQFSAPQS